VRLPALVEERPHLAPGEIPQAQVVERAAAGHRSEIIVVESSGDDTAATIRKRFPTVTVIQSAEQLTAGGARNRGIEAARGRLIFFVDQDCVVPPNWIDALEAHLSDPSVGAAGGSVGIQNPSNWSGCAVYFLEFVYHFPKRDSPARDDNFLVGCNCVYRAEVVRRIRFPDQTLGEDVIFSRQLRQIGYAAIYDPRVEVRHHNREGWSEFLNYNRKMGRASADYHDALKYRWIAPFFAAPFLAFLSPLVILPLVGFDLLRSRWSYFFRFLMLLPICLVGNLVWANAFRRQVGVIKARSQ